jgi:glucosylglycerate hydrolase
VPEADLRAQVRRILEEAWRPEAPGRGHCVPHAITYPWQWLWDSCFHAVVWAHLGDERASHELASALDPMDAEGFVPHMRYVGGHRPHRSFWGRPDTSSITQPPMYGHAVAELVRAGMPVDGDLIERAALGLRFLLHTRRRSPGGLVELCHPWESGCDDSPRWDDAAPLPWSAAGWRDRKGELVATIERSAGGAPIANPGFRVGSAGFSALVAFNALELASVTGDAELAESSAGLTEALDARWDPELATWVDDGPTATGSGRVRTLDARLGALVTTRPAPEVLGPLVDPGAHGAPFGPTGVHRAEPTFDGRTYWRGSAWPQLTYLLWLAATRSGAEGAAVGAEMRRSIEAGALTSGWSEHWDPDTGARLGAAPQTWTTLAWVARAAS